MIHRYMNYLRQSSLFKGFEDLEIETFLNGVENRFIEVKANNKYEPRNSRYVIVLSGLLTVCVTNIKGRKDTIQGFYPVYNEFLSFDVSDYNNKIRTNVFMSSIIAQFDSLLLEVDARDVSSNSIEQIELHYRFHQNAVRALNDTMLHRDIRVWCAIAPSAREKVLRYLLYVYVSQQTERLDIRITRDEIASLLLIDTRTLLRELRNLKNDGIIDYKGKSITILKPEEIAKHSETINKEGGNQNE